MKNNKKIVLLGGFGSLSNNDKQYHQQSRIYDADYMAIALCTHNNPYYLVRKNKDVRELLFIQENEEIHK